MKNGNGSKRLTSAYQSMTFSRRMLIAGGTQAAIGAVLIGRLGWLSVAENEHYQLLSREQSGPADHRPPAARLDRRPRTTSRSPSTAATFAST